MLNDLQPGQRLLFRLPDEAVTGQPVILETSLANNDGTLEVYIGDQSDYVCFFGEEANEDGKLVLFFDAARIEVRPY